MCLAIPKRLSSKKAVIDEVLYDSRKKSIAVKLTRNPKPNEKLFARMVTVIPGTRGLNFKRGKFLELPALKDEGAKVPTMAIQFKEAEHKGMQYFEFFRKGMMGKRLIFRSDAYVDGAPSSYRLSKEIKKGKFKRGLKATQSFCFQNWDKAIGLGVAAAGVGSIFRVGEAIDDLAENPAVVAGKAVVGFFAGIGKTFAGE